MAARHPSGAGGSGRGYPDAFTVATTKLSQDWSANRCVPHINKDWLHALLDDARFGSMDPMLKVRLLLAGMVALNQQSPASNSSSSDPARERLQGALAALQAAAATDADEWVKVTAAAAGQLDGRLDLAAVMQQSAVVQETMTGLKQQMQESNSQQDLFPPLEDVYLRHNPFVLNPDSGHFRLRPNPRVQPLSTRVSYSSVTPPPPALAQIARQGEHHGAAFLRPQAKLSQQRSLPRPGIGAAAAAGEGGNSIALARKGSLAGKGAPKIHLLDEAEQQEMHEVLQKSMKAKGHGVAAHVRHEQVPWHKPRTSEPGQQPQKQQRWQQQQQRQQRHVDDDEHDEETAGDAVMMEYEEQQEQELSDDFEAAEAAAVAAAAAEVAAAGDADDTGGISSRAGRRRRQMAAARGEDADGGSSGVLAAMKQAAAANRIEAQLDALFEDSEDDDDEYAPAAAPAPTGVSRSARGLQHHQADSDGEAAAAAELEDELEDGDAAEGTGNVAAAEAEGMQGVVVEEIGDRDQRQGQQQQQQHVGDDAAAVAAKRRRVIVDDDDDD